MSFGKAKKVILFTGYAAMGDTLTFEQFKTVADNAKATGFTHVDLGSALSRSLWQLDNDGQYAPGYDFYTEYTAVFACPFKFYCPDKLKKYLPQDQIQRNQFEFKRRAEYLAQIGLRGSIIGAFPQWLPEAVYADHPDWRGPRCDMPFRSRRAYFAPCVDNEEVLELYREASRGIGELAPCVDTMIFMTNDSGTSYCWNDVSYPGKNGPASCAHRTMDERVGGFLDALGSGLATDEPLIYTAWQGFWCFSGKISPCQGCKSPERVFFVRPPQDKPVIHENPISMLEELENAVYGDASTIVINIEQCQQLFTRDSLYFALLKKFHDNPTDGPASRNMFMQELAVELGLSDAGDYGLLDAWGYLYRAADDTSLRHLFYYSVYLYGGMSARFMVRPFVPIPENLTDEEKSYYKPYVFDSLDRLDYELDLLNIHGSRNFYMGRTYEEAERSVMCWNSILVTLQKCLANLAALVAKSTGKRQAYLADMLRRLKAFNCFGRNLRNCCAFQATLDRAKAVGFSNLANSDKLEVIMRDELDNAAELIALLEAAPEPILPLATEKKEETTFLFGPDLADQLRKKRQIMLAHWRDSQVLFEFKNRFNQI